MTSEAVDHGRGYTVLSHCVAVIVTTHVTMAMTVTVTVAVTVTVTVVALVTVTVTYDDRANRGDCDGRQKSVMTG